MPLRNQFRPRPVTVAFSAFGVGVSVNVEAGSMRDEVMGLLPPGAAVKAPTAGDRRFALSRISEDSFSVTVGDRLAMHEATRDVALGLLDAQIRLHVAEHAQEYVFVHAGVVARGGLALIAPGMSFSGKSTLVAALIAAGAEYLSDEYAVLAPDGHVLPYPRPISLRTGQRRSTEDSPASAWGAVTASDPCELRAVVLTRWIPGTTWDPEELTRGQGTVAVLANTVPAQRRPQASLRAIERALSQATVLVGDRGDATETARLIIERLPWLAAS